MTTTMGKGDDRRGGVLLVFLAVLLLFGAACGVMIYRGSLASVEIETRLAAGKSLIDQEKSAEAVKEFLAAEADFSFSAAFYRAFSGMTGGKFTSITDVRQLVVTSCLMKIYEEAFEMRPGKEWVETAEARLPLLAASEAAELKQLVLTARETSELCGQFASGKYEDVMRGLLSAEKNALQGDLDFFLQEIRILIACGKAMGEPDILTRAREMLFFLSYEAGVKNPRVDRLWGILHR